jgi:hypothetical protein
VPGDEDHAGDGDRGGGQHAGHPLAAELGGERAGEQHRRRRGQRRRQPQRGKGTRCDQVGQPGEQRGERRLVGITPGQVPASHDVVRLVTVPAVAAAGQHEHREQRAGDGDRPAQPSHPLHRRHPSMPPRVRPGQADPAVRG